MCIGVFFLQKVIIRAIPPATNRDLSWSRRYEVCCEKQQTIIVVVRQNPQDRHRWSKRREERKHHVCVCVRRGEHAGHCRHRRRDDAGSKVGLEFEGRDEPEGVRNSDTER
ncbi:unnamed protein product [Lasius platythorax]|uniref:Secreted protein n=1 Tax=Lasius platythorax TaxID=488582 RepID=A0AAV2ND65_9HYME